MTVWPRGSRPRCHPDEQPGHDQCGEVRAQPVGDSVRQHGQDARDEHPARPELLRQLPARGLGYGAGQVEHRDKHGGAPTGTCTPAAIGTKAVARIELLTGFSAEPMNSGVTNRHENMFPGVSSPMLMCRAAATSCGVRSNR